MNYTASIFKRRRHKKLEYLARLRYCDEETGVRKEKSRSAPTLSEAKRLLRDMEDEFESGGQTAMESDHMTFAELAKHCKETRYCEAQFDSEGRKIIGVRGRDTIESQIKCQDGRGGTVRKHHDPAPPAVGHASLEFMIGHIVDVVQMTSARKRTNAQKQAAEILIPETST